METVTRHPADIGPMTWGSRCTLAQNIWWVSWRSFRRPSDTRTCVRPTWRGRTPQYRTPWSYRTACWSDWRSPQLNVSYTTAYITYTATYRIQHVCIIVLVVIITMIRLWLDHCSTAICLQFNHYLIPIWLQFNNNVTTVDMSVCGLLYWDLNK